MEEMFCTRPYYGTDSYLCRRSHDGSSQVELRQSDLRLLSLKKKVKRNFLTREYPRFTCARFRSFLCWVSFLRKEAANEESGEAQEELRGGHF